MIRPSDFSVTASVPCFGANRYVRRAVESLLAQTHTDLTVVVVNDGDNNPPWSELAHLHDPRLVRFSLERNHGPYFVHHVVLAASDTPYFLIQDADDWSAPNRVRKLLSQLLLEGSDLAFSAWQQYRQDGNGTLRPDSVRWHRRDARAQMPLRPCSFLFDPVLTDTFINRASHHGVFRRKALERIGGYYGGFRMNHDTLLTNLLLMTGKVSFVEAPLYHYVIRHDSLSHSRATGARSSARAYVRGQQETIYSEGLHWYRAWNNQTITSEDLVSLVRELATRFVTAPDRAEIAVEVRRLKVVMRSKAGLLTSAHDPYGFNQCPPSRKIR